MNKVFLYIAILLIGFVIGWFVSNRSANTKVQQHLKIAQQTEARLNLSIDSLVNQNKAISKDNNTLFDKILLDSVERSAKRLKIIPKQTTLQNENIVLHQGQTIYGLSNPKNSKRSNVASYGAQAITEVIHRRKITGNQKVVIANCEKIVIIKDTIIVKYKKGLEFAAKKSKKNEFVKGAGVGAGLTILIFALFVL